MKISRKQFIQSGSAALAVVALQPIQLLQASEDDAFKALVFKIGNANTEKERANILKIALSQPGYSREQKAILESIYDVADRWANGFEKYGQPGLDSSESNGYLCGFLKDGRIDRHVLPRVDESSASFPLIAFYRSRMLLANLIQHGDIVLVPHIRQAYIDESFRLLEAAQNAFPDNTLIPAYLGDLEPWTDLVETNDQAPAWANLQRKVLAKLQYLIHWWVDNRQISDGQFGGGWGDDVEMWRSWVPVLFAFDDEKAINSQEKLFEGLYSMPRMERGYTTRFSDVEHTSEEYADPLTCMLNLQPDNPIWEQRVLMALQYIESEWSGVNDRGFLQFKSTWFSIDRIDMDTKRACDSPYHTRLVQPLMLIWLRTGHEKIGKFLESWLTTWVEATMRVEGGKPKGIIPTAIHWPDGKAHGTGKDWWKPENYHTPLYDYPSQQSSMYECFLQAYHTTKDEKYLEPIRFIAKLRLDGLGSEPADSYTEGSLDWCLAKLGDSIAQILLKYRILTGDLSYDSLLKNDAKDYERFLLDKNIDQLSNSLEELHTSLSLPEVFFTAEVRWTDRLFAFGKFFNFILDKPRPLFDAGFLFSCLSGSVGDFKVMPVFGVKWLTTPDDIAILTETNTNVKFKARLFHFGNEPRSMGARLFNLEKGNYSLELTGLKTKSISISPENNTVQLTLPSQTLAELSIRKV